MGSVRLWLKVSWGGMAGSREELFTKRMTTDFLPDVEGLDKTNEDRDEIGQVAWYVKNRYWNSDGSVHVEMKEMVVDPDPYLTPQINSVGSVWHKYNSTWWTDRDGDPLRYLTAGDWITWEQWKGAEVRA